MHALASAVRPRARHTLIHGELGPDHVLVGAGGEPVPVDIEGLLYFGPEWEHVFLELRFGPHYASCAPRASTKTGSVSTAWRYA